MSRLTNEFFHTPEEIVGYSCDEICNKEISCEECPIQEAFNKLTHYEDLDEAGRLIELPCKDGATVYWITTYGVLERYAAITEPIHSKIVELRPFGLDDELYPFPVPTFFREFGESVFLTKAEAEAKLAELKGDA